MISIFNKLRPKKGFSSLNILHLGAYNIANVPYTLSQGLNSLTEHRSICTTLIHPYCDYLKYPEDLMLSDNLSPSLLFELIREADIIHMHNSLHQIVDNPQLRGIDELLASKSNKFLHAHGTYHRVYSDLIEKIKIRCGGEFKDIIATPDNALVSQFPEAKYIPNPIKVEEYRRYYIRDELDTAPIKIAHSPTHRPSKSTHYLEQVILPELQKRSSKKIHVEYIYNKSNDDCLTSRSNCILNFDQILIGTYGLGAQESIAQGLIPIVRIGSKTSNYLKVHFGFDHPFLITTSPDQEKQFEDIISVVDVGSDKSPPPEIEITTKTLEIQGFSEQLITTTLTLIESYKYRNDVRIDQLNWLKKTHDLPIVIDVLIKHYLTNLK